MTTLVSEKEKSVRMKLTYYPPLTNKLTKCLRTEGIKPAFASVNSFISVKRPAVAQHYGDEPSHVFDDQNFKLTKSVEGDKYLDACESLYMFKYKDRTMNVAPPPKKSRLFKYC